MLALDGRDEDGRAEERLNAVHLVADLACQLPPTPGNLPLPQVADLLLLLGKEGVAAKRLTDARLQPMGAVPQPMGAVEVPEAWSYRATGVVAVQLKLVGVTFP